MERQDSRLEQQPELPERSLSRAPLLRADDVFIQQAALKLRDGIKRGLTTNPITLFRELLVAYRQTPTVEEPAVETVMRDVPSTPRFVPQEAADVSVAAPVFTPPVQELEQGVEMQETTSFSIQETAALSLLVGSLNGTSIGIDENTVFEFKVEKEVVDICNLLVWSLPFEYRDTIKLYAKDYLNLRKSALEKVKSILMLDEAQILEVATKQGHENIENLLVGLAIKGAQDRQQTVWFINQILERSEAVAWNDETGYITQLWREDNVSSIDQGSSLVNVIENTLQTEDYLEIIPIGSAKPAPEAPNGHEIKVGKLERRDSEARAKIKEYIGQVRKITRMPSWVNSGQISQYFKPAIRASEIEELLKSGFIAPVTERNNVPYYDIDDLVVLLYMRKKPERIDITGLQTELKKIVAEELTAFGK